MVELKELEKIGSPILKSHRTKDIKSPERIGTSLILEVEKKNKEQK